ncbi:MAG: hypothetical protein PHF33_05335 [Candidatus Delongbacteria bacterium]|nr:hypothetical protein [Candidatus Delongbacteria bacterium]
MLYSLLYSSRVVLKSKSAFLFIVFLLLLQSCIKDKSGTLKEELKVSELIGVLPGSIKYLFNINLDSLKNTALVGFHAAFEWHDYWDKALPFSTKFTIKNVVIEFIVEE